MPVRSDYVQIFGRDGVDGLNRVLAERYAHAWDYARELRRMSDGMWVTRWNKDLGRDLVIGRKPEPTDDPSIKF